MRVILQHKCTRKWLWEFFHRLDRCLWPSSLWRGPPGFTLCWYCLYRIRRRAHELMSMMMLINLLSCIMASPVKLKFHYWQEEFHDVYSLYFFFVSVRTNKGHHHRCDQPSPARGKHSIRTLSATPCKTNICARRRCTSFPALSCSVSTDGHSHSRVSPWIVERPSRRGSSLMIWCMYQEKT